MRSPLKLMHVVLPLAGARSRWRRAGGDAGHLREIIDPDDDVVEDAGLTENLVTVLVFPFSEDIAPLCGWAATPRTRCALSNEGRVDPRDMWTGIIYEPFRAHEVPENRAKVGEEANERAHDE